MVRLHCSAVFFLVFEFKTTETPFDLLAPAPYTEWEITIFG